MIADLPTLMFSPAEDTGDTRESASITLINNFFAEAANVNVYDPEVKEAQIWNDLTENGGSVEAYKKKITVTQTALEACEGAAAIVIATEWDEFKTLDWNAVYDKMSKPAFVFDGRLILDAPALRKIGFSVHQIGSGWPSL